MPTDLIKLFYLLRSEFFFLRLLFFGMASLLFHLNINITVFQISNIRKGGYSFNSFISSNEGANLSDVGTILFASDDESKEVVDVFVVKVGRLIKELADVPIELSLAVVVWSNDMLQDHSKVMNYLVIFLLKLRL